MNNISALLQLEHNCRNCENYMELKYTIVNETRNLLDYEQAIFLAPNYSGKLKVEAISDISAIDFTSPFVQCIESISNKIYKSNNKSTHILNNKEEIETYQSRQLKELSYENVLWLRLEIKKEDITSEYFLVLLKKEQWTKKEEEIGTHLSSSFAYFLYATRKGAFKSNLKKSSFGSFLIKLSLLCLIPIMFIPIKLTVLAPLEVIAKDPFIVTSALEGVVSEIKVKSNEYVKKDTLIVKLNDTDYLNKYLIAQKTLNVAKAQLHTSQQASFYDVKQKNQLEELKAQVQLKQSELDFTKEQLDKTLIYSKKDGIVIIHNPNEWKGKPVVTGERIFQIANKQNIELKIMLPVSDAIFLEDNAKIKAFLDNNPLDTWDGKITHISYKPELTPENILAYKITAQFDHLQKDAYIPTIGLRGTAKIYSHEVSLFFYIFRKPITSLRQLVGW
ncbi:efflux RND transporter periplasmic adaptor subunit [Poseidonibacter sp.]|uniref:efflux RND transporter periplasmic adaptor subunit n=1 Tax=Poseidonibacter sp. TaxID=2321188 RepID=UPI003C71B8EC